MIKNLFKNKSFSTSAIAIIISCFFGFYSFAQLPGTLDSSFGGTGIVMINNGINENFATSVEVQNDGKIVVCGLSGSDILLTRFKTNGIPDSSFGNEGKVIYTNANSFSLAIQNDGKIIVGGSSGTGVNSVFIGIRFNSNGMPDTTFGIMGKTVIPIGNNDATCYSVALQADGKIVLAGSSFNGLISNLALVRLTNQGIIDSTFGINGIVVNTLGDGESFAQTLLIQPDGKIVAGGCSQLFNGTNYIYQFCLVRFDSSGNLDMSFGTNGLSALYPGIGTSVVLQNDGKILLAGRCHISSADYATIIRFNTDGSIDPLFGNNGILSTSIVMGDFAKVKIYSNSEIVITSSSDNGSDFDIAVGRYHMDGSPDISFGTNGKVITAIGSNNEHSNCLAIQNDGKIVVAGSTRNSPIANSVFIILRYFGGYIPAEVTTDPLPQEVCEGQPSTFSVAALGSIPIYYQWYFNHSILNGENNSILSFTNTNIVQAGSYFCIVTNQGGADTSSIVQLTVNPLPIVNIGNDISLCSGTSASLCPGHFSSYNWNNGASTDSIIVSATGDFCVTVSDGNGCVNSSDTVHVVLISPYANQELCMVTFDTLSKHNLVIWEKSVNEGIAAYRLYRESGSSGNYIPIATIAFNAISQFLDTIADPQAFSYKYKISIIDTCLNESALSNFYRTMQLTVSANTSGGGYNLIWTDYMTGIGQYADHYTIYRGFSPNLLVPVYNNVLPSGSGITTMVDFATGYPKYYYRIGYSIPNSCTSSLVKDNATTYIQSFSNTVEISSSGVDLIHQPMEFLIFPSVVQNEFTIETSAEGKQYFDIVNSLGQVIHSLCVEQKGNFDVSFLPAGVYIVRFASNTSAIVKRIVKQ